MAEELLSIVIASRNRPERLTSCLDTLRTQTHPGVALDILVVDDGSEPSLEPVVASAKRSGLAVRYVRQSRSGLSAARNLGVQETTGQTIAFLDDDTLVSPGWTGAMSRTFATSKSDVVAGRILLRLEGKRPFWLTDMRASYLGQFDLGVVSRRLTMPPFGFGGNLAITREALVGVGGFRLDLGRDTRSLLSNEETDLVNGIVKRGGSVMYCAEATVLHCVPPDRLTKPWFRERARAQGISDARSADPGGKIWGGVGREIVRAGRALPILARRLVEGRGPFDAELWLVYCWARAVEVAHMAR